MTRAITLWLLCVALALPVLAQTVTPDPGPERKKLDVFVGDWDFAGEVKAVPELGMTDAGPVTYHHVNQMTNGGFFLESRRTGSSPRGPVTELFVYGYDPGTKSYRQYAFDNRGRMRVFTATVDGLRWSFTGTSTGADGTVTTERYTLTYAADLKSATVRSEHSQDGKVWHERLTGTYTKSSTR